MMWRRRVRRVPDGAEFAAYPYSIGSPDDEWTAGMLAVAVLMRVPPTDRALAGWDPGYWHLPEREG